MANIILTIPDDKIVAATNHAARALNYPALVPGEGNIMVANPETKAQFVRRMLGLHLKALIIKGAREAAAETAAETAQTAADAISVT